MKSRGFTLIELLVVAYNGYTKSAKTAVVKANEKTIIKFVQLTLQRCDIEGGLIQIEGVTSPNGGKINCSVSNGTDEIGQVNDIFVNYLKDRIGNNPFDNSQPGVLRSGRGQIEGTISFDQGVGATGQCNSDVTNKTKSVLNCIKVITWLSAYPNGRNDVDIFMSHW